MFLWTQGEEEGKGFLNKTQKALTMKEEINLSYYIKNEKFLYIRWHHKKEWKHKTQKGRRQRQQTLLSSWVFRTYKNIVISKVN